MEFAATQANPDGARTAGKTRVLNLHSSGFVCVAAVSTAKGSSASSASESNDACSGA